MNKRLLLTVLIIFIYGILRSQAYYDSVWTNYFRLNGGGWTAGDATISVKLPDNRVIWLFGDSYTVPVNTSNNTLPCLFQVRNCYMVQDSVDPSHFITILDTTQTGVNQTTFKIALNDTAIFWPGAGYVRDDTVFIFLERYNSSTLAYLGCYIAKLEFPSLHEIGIYKVHDNGASIFGRAVYVDEADQKLYIYGNKVNWIVQEPVVARCDISNPMGPWEYWKGTGWTTFAERVVKISDEVVSPGFSFFRYEDKYVLVTQENGYLECGLGREIYSMESNNPWGPFVNKKLLYTEESMFNGHYLLTYNAQAHPWSLDDGDLLIGYNVNDRVDQTAPNICPSQCVNIWTDRMDADSYRPKFIRVPMGMIVSTGKEFQKDFHIRISPNPVKRGEEVNFSCNLLSSEKMKIITTDLTGRIISQETINADAGENKMIIKSPSEPGIFILSLITKSGKQGVKLIVI